MVADVAIHADNPHAHIMLTLRPIVAGADGGEAHFGAKERSWNARDMLLGWRSKWTHACNRALEPPDAKNHPKP
jgi:hypothetical protein